MRTRLTIVAVLLVTLTLSASPVAASSSGDNEWSFSPLTWIVELLPDGWVTTLAKYGAEFDPNGESSDYGPAADPNGAPSDYGPAIDPNGAEGGD